MDNKKPKPERGMTEELPPDPDALEKWQNLPQGTPSKDALPPAAGGIPTIFKHVFPRGLLWLFLAMFVLSLIIGALTKLL